MWTRAAITLVAACALAAVVAPAGAAAAVFTPGCDVPGLVLAVDTASTNGQSDTIELAAGCTYDLTAGLVVPDDGGGNVLAIHGNGATLDGQGATRILRVEPNAVLAVDSVTLTRGRAADGAAGAAGQPGAAGGDGGAIHNQGSLTLTNATLSNNRAGDGGKGADGVPGTSPGQSGGAGGAGGAIHNQGNLTLTNGTFSDNGAGAGGNGGNGVCCNAGAGGPGGAGGAIRNEGTLDVQDSSFTGNTTGKGGDGGIDGFSGGNGGGDGGGGGAIHSTGPLTVTNATLTANTTGDGGNGPLLSGGGAGGRGGGGGAIHAGAALTVANATLAANTTGHGGGGGSGGSGSPGGGGGKGGAIHATAALTVANATLAANTTGNGGNGGNGGLGGSGGGSEGGDGGAIHASATLTVANATLSANTTGIGGHGGDAAFPGDGGRGGDGGDGGAVAGAGATGVTNGTLSGNATGRGGGGGLGAPPGGLGAAGAGRALAALGPGSATVANTIAMGASACSGTVADGGSNLAPDDDPSSCGFAGAGGDPQLGPLQDNGGPTETMALAPGSAALDAGDDAVCAAAVGAPGAGGVDQRGVARPQGPGCDIGAFEARPPRVGLSDTDLDFLAHLVGAAGPDRTVTITNTGDMPLTIAALAFAGANPGDFAVTDENCTGTPIAPGGSCAADIAFFPTAAGARSGTLEIDSDAHTSPDTVALTGTGLDPPALPTVSPAPSIEALPAAAQAQVRPAHAEVIVTGPAQLRRARRGRPLLLTGLAVRCPAGLPRGCGGSGRVTVTADSSLAARRRTYTVAKLGFAVPSGQTRAVRIRLTRRGERIARRISRLRVTLRITTRGLRGARVVTRRTASLRLR